MKKIFCDKNSERLGVHTLSIGFIRQEKALLLAEKLKGRLGSQLIFSTQTALQCTRIALKLVSALVAMKAEGHADQNLALCAEPLIGKIFNCLFKRK